MPLGFVSSFGYGTVLIAVFIFYILVSIELLAEEIEDPFGIDDNINNSSAIKRMNSLLRIQQSYDFMMRAVNDASDNDLIL